MREVMMEVMMGIETGDGEDRNTGEDEDGGDADDGGGDDEDDDGDDEDDDGGETTWGIGFPLWWHRQNTPLT